MKDTIEELAKKLGMSRREFMKLSAQSGAILGATPFMAGCSNKKYSDSTKEKRTYYFDLSHTDEGDEHYLMLGSKMLKLNTCTSQVIEKSGNPLLQAIPEGSITHHITHDFPSDSIQACHIRTIKPGDPDGVWNMPLSFFHLPSSSVRRAALIGEGTLESSAKHSYYGIDTSVLDGMDIQDAYLYTDDVKTWADLAIDLAFHHSEILCMEKDSAAQIQLNILANETGFLTGVLQSQGTATESGGWATQETLEDSDGNPYYDSSGKKQYFPRYSDETNTYLGAAINPSLDKVKNDLSLGVNITDLDPEVENSKMNGKIWKIYDGITTVKADQLLESDGFLTCPNKSRRHGYKATFISEVDHTVTFKVENWYVRYLGIFVQFLDSNGNEIKLSDLPSETINSFAYPITNVDGTYSKFAGFIGSEWEVLGIPIHHPTEEVSFFWPDSASSAKIIAGGWGANSNENDDHVDYTKIILPGGLLTTMVNLALPGLFLMYGAGSGYSAFVLSFRMWRKDAMILFLIEIIAVLGVDIVTLLAKHDPKMLIELGKKLMLMFLEKGAEWVFTKDVQAAIDEGEVLDHVPLIGKVLAAAAALESVIEMAQTIGEVLASPVNYVDALTATHDIVVTINPDTRDTAGFPAVADYYVVKAMFDSGSPHSSGQIRMPGTTWTDPIKHTFYGVPYGGHVKICVGFYADTDDWLAGDGCTDNKVNTINNVEITIEEYKVPIDITTVYSHKQKITLDADGNHVWTATSEDAPAPSEKADSFACESVDGSLCELNGITISEMFGTFGYGWKSYSSDITSCGGSGVGQLHQIATASITQNPQDSYLPPKCGFPSPSRIVFDLMSNSNNNYYLDTQDSSNDNNLNNHVRQITLSLDGTPTIDGSDSNRSWGRFNNSSDALVLHPSRKLISINRVHNKVEVLTLPDTVKTDAQAPIAVAYSGGGMRHGLVSGPVAAAVSSDGVILILESKNKRIQAFDTGMNPVPYFTVNGAKSYSAPLIDQDPSVTIHYLDMAIEYANYIYVLSYEKDSMVYRLDIYHPEGYHLARTTDVNAAKLTVDFWRNVYTLNYEVLKLPNGDQPTITEPSVSEWIPSVP